MLLSTMNAFIIRAYFENLEPIDRKRFREVAELTTSKFNERCTQSRVRYVVSKFKKHDTIDDRRQKHSGRMKTATGPANTATVINAIDADPEKSIQRLLRETQISYTSIQRILKREKYFPYLLFNAQILNDCDKSRRRYFCEWIRNPGIDIHKIFFSDEILFYTNGPQNGQNKRFWAKNRPQEFVNGFQAHPPEVMVWAAVSSIGVLGPYFLKDKVTSVRYNELLRNHVMPEIQRKFGETENFWFMQDGAPAHTTNLNTSYLREKFNQKLISFRSRYYWPPHSPDLNPLDFSVWNSVQVKVYEAKCSTVESMKTVIIEEFSKLSTDLNLCKSLTNEFKRRTESCHRARGSYFEQLM